MSSFQDITIPSDVWTDVSTTVGVAAAVGLIVTNVSSPVVRIEESTLEPSVNNIGFPLQTGGQFNSTVETSPPATQLVWARPIGGTDAILHTEQV